MREVLRRPAPWWAVTLMLAGAVLVGQAAGEVWVRYLPKYRDTMIMTADLTQAREALYLADVIPETGSDLSPNQLIGYGYAICHAGRPVPPLPDLAQIRAAARHRLCPPSP